MDILNGNAGYGISQEGNGGCSRSVETCGYAYQRRAMPDMRYQMAMPDMAKLWTEKHL